MKKSAFHFGAFVFTWLAAIPCFSQAQNTFTPPLSIRVTGASSVTLSWSNVAPGFVLQEVATLSSTETWRGILQTPLLQGGELAVSQPLSNAPDSARFYRLVAKGAPAGLDYLLSRQNPDGTFGFPNRTLFRDTAGVLETMALFGPADPRFANALSSLSFLSPRNNDDLARKAIALASAGQDVSALSGGLLNSQNDEISDDVSTSYPGRGWGLAAGYGNSTLDSALVLRALKSAGKAAGLSLVREPLAGLAVSPAHSFNVPTGSSQPFLIVRKVTGIVRLRITYPDGGSSLSPDLSSASVPTGYVFPAGAGLLALTVENRSASPANCTAEVGFFTPDGWDTFQISTPLTYLGLAQNPDGGWGIAPGEDSHFMITAEVLRTLALWQPSLAADQPLQAGATWLRARQQADGGFSSATGPGNVHDTSLALLALNAADPGASLSSGATFLRNSQLPDGSWTGDAYQTALATRALRLPPFVAAIPSQTVTAPTSFAPISLDNFVSDPDNSDSQLGWSVTGNSLLTVNISNRVAFLAYTPGTNTNTLSETLTFIATDPGGASGSATASFVILPNHPPVVGPIPGQSVGAPGAFTPIYLDNFVFDPEETTNQISWAVTGNTQLTVSLSNRVVFITYPTNITNPINEPLTFTATDLVGWSASATATFFVAPNQPPVVSSIPGQTVTAPYPFAPVSLDNYVADPDDSDNRITWVVTGNVRLAVNISNRVATFTYSGSPTSSITEQLTFTARDPVGSSASTTATFVVTPNHAPVVSPIPGQTVTAPYPFAPISLDNYVADADEPDTQITWRVSGNTRLAVTISNRIALLTYTGSATNVFTEQLTFTATDPVGLSNSTSAIFSVGPNRPPVVSPIPAQTNSFPYLFTPISLDNFVADPEEPASNMIWAVTGKVRFTVTLSNRVAYVAYPSPVTTNIVEQLTFTATDPVGLTGATTTTFSIRSNSPPVVSPIPGRTNEVPVPFPAISLDNYVADPDESDSQLIWTVTGNTNITVSIANRVATLSYPAGTTNSFNEQLIFRATDPQGNFGSITSRFAAIYFPPDYTIPRGGSTNSFRIFGASLAAWNQASNITTTVFNDQPAWLTYTKLGTSIVSDTDERMDYRISAAANTPIATYQIRVEYGLEDINHQPLGPLTNNIYNFRIKVTP